MNEVNREADEKSSSKADVNMEPGAKTPKRAHVAINSQLPEGKTIVSEAMLNSLP